MIPVSQMVDSVVVRNEVKDYQPTRRRPRSCVTSTK